MSGPSIFKSIKWALFGFLTTLLILIVISSILIGSSAGRSWLLGSLAPVLLASTGYQLEVEQVDSPNLGTWRIQRLQIKQGETALLDARQLHLQWTPSDLLNQHLSIQNLSADAVDVFLPFPKNPKVESPTLASNQRVVVPALPINLDQFKVSQLHVHHPSLPDQQRYALTGRLALKPDGLPLQITFDAHTLSGVLMTVSLQTHLNNDQQAVIEGRIEEQAGGAIGSLIRQPSNQPVMATFSIHLKENAGVYNADIHQFSSQYQGYPIQLKGQTSVDLVKDTYTGTLDLSIGQQQQRVKGSVHHKQLNLTSTLDDLPLDLLSPWLPEPISGTASGEASITGTLNQPQAVASIELDTTFRGVAWQVKANGSGSRKRIVFNQLKVRSDTVEAQAKGHVNLAQQTLAAQLSSTDLPLTFIQTLLPDTVPDAIQGAVTTELKLNGPWTAPQVDGQASFQGSYKNIPLNMAVKGKGDPQRFELQKLQINTDQQGQLTASGLYHPQQLDFSIQASALPSEIFDGLGWKVQPGQLNANLDLKGTPKRPRIDGVVNLKTTLSREAGDEESITLPLHIEATAKTIGEQLDVRADIHESNETLGHIQLSAPLYRYLNLETDDKIPLRGNLSTDLDLSYLRLVLDPDEHTPGGRLQANIQLAGTLSAPQLKGQATLLNGRYENAISGTVLNQINATVKFDRQTLTILDAKATDGETGSLLLSGKADWSNRQQAVNLKLKINDANILRRHDIEGVANGHLALAGNLETLNLTGNLDISPFTLYLDNLQSNRIPSLKVTEVDSSTAKLTSTSSETSNSQAPTIRMDLTLKADQRAFLRGQGLEAELEGKVSIQGTLNRSKYAGQFKTVRGHYEILGKRFSLENGWVRFEGDQIVLLINGLHKAKETDIRAQLAGSLDNLSLILTSDPVLPEDEIIARLLFGKSVRNVSPLQAIQLASAVNQLRTGGRSLFDPIGTARNLIGADTLSIGSTEAEDAQGVAIGVGKYVSEKVYIEIESDSGAAQPWKGSVEIEVAPNLSVESTTGGDSGLGGIELQWKKDY